jgi:hypothetical protein
MGSKPRGRVLIINNRKFSDGEVRKGSEIDYNNLSRLFSALSFDVAKSQDQLTDLTSQVLDIIVIFQCSRLLTANINMHTIYNILNQPYTNVVTDA